MGASKKEDAQRGERRRVILPRPVISDICISLSLTVPQRRKRFTCEWPHFERRKNDCVLVNKNCLRNAEESPHRGRNCEAGRKGGKEEATEKPRRVIMKCEGNRKPREITARKNYKLN